MQNTVAAWYRANKTLLGLVSVGLLLCLFVDIVDASHDRPQVPLKVQGAGASVGQLWGEMADDVHVSNVTNAVIPGEPLSSSEVRRPPNMPGMSCKYRLKPDFVWGVSGSSYQIEGAVMHDGRGPSIWDVMSHQTNYSGGATGDVATNHYFRYQQDAQMLSALHVPYYAMSISWSRIFPSGHGEVNQAGLQHYIDEVNYLLNLGIEPVITLYHWDLPYALQQEYGGWLDRRIVGDFVQYAKVMFDALGPKVRYWFTLNEPQSFCNELREMSEFIQNDTILPMHGVEPRAAQFMCGHNALLAHAKTVELFRQEVVPQYPDRRISYKNSFAMVLPSDQSNVEDVLAANRSMQFGAGWFSKPVHGDGDYPQCMKDSLGDLLPEFTNEEKQLIKNSADFYTWDGYTGTYMKAPRGGFHECVADPNNTNWPVCGEYVNKRDGWLMGQPGEPSWLFTTPNFVREGVKWAWNEYNLTEIMLGEIGFSVGGENDMTKEVACYDTLRVDYFDMYLHTVLKIVHKDQINLSGVFAWALQDNMEWKEGYNQRFGLQYVDFETEERSFKKSAFYFADFFRHYVAAS